MAKKLVKLKAYIVQTRTRRGKILYYHGRFASSKIALKDALAYWKEEPDWELLGLHFHVVVAEIEVTNKYDTEIERKTSREI